METSMLSTWIKSQKALGSSLKNTPLFYRNLEEALDVRRGDHALYTIKKNLWRDGNNVDFCSNDILSLGGSGTLRKEFMEELNRQPNLPPGAGGSRMMDGNYDYIETVEQEVADFHGAETGLIVGSGFEANIAIFAAIPRPGDAIVYDELVHASTHDGMQQSLATCRVPFRHNDIDSFRDALSSVHDSQPLIQQGKRSVLVAVESIYSMEGDICPLDDLIQVAKEVFPGGTGNCQFIVDEAHSTGIIGPNGAGLVCHLGLESQIAVRLHTFGKALASAGAIILGNKTVKLALTNFARSVIYTTAPSFPVIAAIRSGYGLLKDGKTQEAQETIQRLARHFFKTITSNPIFEEAEDKGILSMPLSDEWEDRPIQTHILPLWTRPRYNYWLMFHLVFSGFTAFPVDYPIVPKGTSRIRLTLHANNTEAEVDGLVSAICEWTREMIQIEESGGGDKIPRAARQVYAWMANDDSSGTPAPTELITPWKPAAMSHDAQSKTSHESSTTGSTQRTFSTNETDITQTTTQAPSMSAPEVSSEPPNEISAAKAPTGNSVEITASGASDQKQRLKKHRSFFVRLRNKWKQ